MLAVEQSWGGGASITLAVIVPTAVTSPSSWLLCPAMLQSSGSPMATLGTSNDQLPRMWSPAGTIVLKVISALAPGVGSEMAVISKLGPKPSG